MTREEAIHQLELCKSIIRKSGQDWLDDRDMAMLDMAIEALEEQVIICKECKHNTYCCRLTRRTSDSFCSEAERRTDEGHDI